MQSYPPALTLHLGRQEGGVHKGFAAHPTLPIRVLPAAKWIIERVSQRSTVICHEKQNRVVPDTCVYECGGDFECSDVIRTEHVSRNVTESSKRYRAERSLAACVVARYKGPSKGEQSNPRRALEQILGRKG